MRDVETAHRERLFDRNKRLSSKKPLIMSGFPALAPKIGFVSYPTFLMFSIRWDFFHIFPFSSASIHVHLRPNDSQASRNWLCFEKCRPTRCLEAQCHIVFPLPDICINCGADPLVRGRRPRRPVRGWMRLIFLAKSGSRGTRADQGVRPTIYAGFPVSGKLYDIGLIACHESAFI